VIFNKKIIGILTLAGSILPIIYYGGIQIQNIYLFSEDFPGFDCSANIIASCFTWGEAISLLTESLGFILAFAISLLTMIRLEIKGRIWVLFLWLMSVLLINFILVSYNISYFGYQNILLFPLLYFIYSNLFNKISPK
jgi:hypothetical protein